MIVGLLAVAWGPLFVADLVRTSSPALDASYGPQGFGMAWMFVTLACTFLAIVAAVVHLIRFFVLVLQGRIK